MQFREVEYTFLDDANVSAILQYDGDARLIVVDVKKPIGERKSDLTHMAYYMEKDVRWSIFHSSF